MKRLIVLMLVLLLCPLAAADRAVAQGDLESDEPSGAQRAGHPIELALTKAGSTNIDLRLLPRTPPREREREENEGPEPEPRMAPGVPPTLPAIPGVEPGRLAPAPAPTLTFDGLDRLNWGAGSPPDTNGDVGPNHYIQTVNTSIGIYDKSTGAQITAFTFDTLMSQGTFGNQCDTENFGDPVVLYDTFEDRWVISDFAFTLDGGGNVNPAEAFQCFAVSKTGDPVSGGWNFYSIRNSDGLNDYPKLGVWTDGIYMSSNMFGFASGASFQGFRVWAFNKAQMYAGAPTVQVVSFSPGTGDFTVIPSNARLQTGTPPPGMPNYFISSWNFLNGLTVYKFHADWAHPAASTFTGPDVPLAATSWPNAAVANAGQPGTATLLDVLQIRAMVQNQYTNFGGVESLWTTHTVRRANTTGFAAPRWYQVDVTGGTVAANIPQAATWDPDAANVINRFIPSLALDRGGNMALGYSTSVATASGAETASTIFPSIRYAGRLAGDPVNTFSKTEQVLLTGTASQTGSTRWGDYAAMTLDPDGCTFWFTSEYANPASQAANARWLTRVGKFQYSECTPVGAGGTLSGTVTASVGGAPISGATVALGSRTTTTDGAGNYQFTALPAGTYPSVTASAPGYNSSTATSVVVTDGGTTDQDFSLGTAVTSACLTDTTQTDFSTNDGTNVDITTSPGDVVLTPQNAVNQQNATVGTSGVGITVTTWGGQTFTPSVSGNITQVDVNLFCSGCTGTTPNLTLSIRATSGGLPTGADLATGTITGFSSGSSAYYTAVLGAPLAVTSGTQYAFVIRPTANPSPGTYALTRSGTSTAGADVYAGGTRVAGATSGTVWSIPLTGGVSTDSGFKIYIPIGYNLAGNLVSSAKDANPAVSAYPTWTTLSWTNNLPANTAISFQVAGSNSATGPFSFVGPDNTAGTFFTTSGASLSQFNGNRYIKYKAYLSTSDVNQTPALNDVTTCFADGRVDLTLAKSDGGASVAPGGTVSYTLTYGNAGTLNSSGVVLTDTVPANTTFNSGASTAGWACTPDNNAGSTCTLAVGAVSSGSSGLTASFAATAVNPAPAGADQISNSASIADDGVNGTDLTPGDNSASDTTPVDAAPDMTISKSDGGASALPGGSIVYALSYTNAGNQNAAGVVITETVPANTTFDAGNSNAFSCSPNNNAGSTCTITIGTVAAGGNGSVNFAVLVDSPATGVTLISNTATIADDGNNGADPNPGDNSSTDTTPVGNLNYFTVAPCRLVDTRDITFGAWGPPSLAANSTRTFVASGQCGVPSNAQAISINVTVLNGTAAGDLRAYPTGITAPLVSVINYRAGQTRANNAVVALGNLGDFVMQCDQSSGTVDLLIDVNGYFAQ